MEQIALSSASVAVSSTSMPRKTKARSAVSNGKRTFVNGNGKSIWARRYRDLIEMHVADAGGPGRVSEAQMSLIRRAATIEIELEAAEGKLSKGEAVDLPEYTRATGHLRRILETIGIKRAQKPRRSIRDELMGSPP